MSQVRHRPARPLRHRRVCSTTRSGRSATPCAASATTGSARTSPSGSRPPRSRRATWPRSSARSGCWACTWRATAAPAPARRRTAWRAWSSKRPTRGMRSLVSVQGSLAMFAIYRFGSDEQKEHGCRGWPPARRSGASGSPRPTSAPTPAACARAARRDGDDWVLNGTKMWITNGAVADVAVVWARTDDGHPRLRRPDRHAGLLRPRDQAEDVAAGVGDQRAGARGRPAAGVGDASRGEGAGRTAVLPDRGTASASCSAPWARRATAWRRRSPTRRAARCSTSRSRRTSSPRRSSPT